LLLQVQGVLEAAALVLDFFLEQGDGATSMGITWLMGACATSGGVLNNYARVQQDEISGLAP
jgi:hypothetical protein